MFDWRNQISFWILIRLQITQQKNIGITFHGGFNFGWRYYWHGDICTILNRPTGHPTVHPHPRTLFFSSSACAFIRYVKIVQVKFARAAKIYSYWNREVIYSQHLTFQKDLPQIIINTYIQFCSVQIENSLKSPLQTIHCMYCKHISMYWMRNKIGPQKARASEKQKMKMK